MGRLSTWAEERSAPVAATVAMVVVVMAFSLFGHAAVHVGRPGLVSPSDLWSLATASSAILHGHFADVYVRNGALTSPPAFEMLLVPVMALGGLLGLSPHLHTNGEPLSMWFVLGPAAVVLASTALFAIDAVARQWRFSERSRLALALSGGLGVANVAGGWGHPEDCVAVALVVWAALTMDRRGAGSAPRAALLLGVAIAFQPLAVLGVAPVLARVGWRRAAKLSWLLVLPAVVVVLPPLVTETHRTLFVLVRQPFQPAYVSPTPLTHLAPVIGPGLDGGGPTRLIASLLGAALAVLVCRRRHDLATVLAVTAAAFFIRVLLETELNWYYLWPVPALCLLLSMRRSTMRFAVCTVALVVSIVVSVHDRLHHGPLWWPTLMSTLVVMLLCAGPSPRRWVGLTSRRQRRAPSEPVEFEAMGEPVGVGPKP